MTANTMTTNTVDRPGEINARPVRHPGRWVAVAVIAVIAAMMVNSFITNEKWDWNYTFQIMQQKPVINGLWQGTILGTVIAMAIGIVLGVMLAIMRMSDNPVLRGVAFVYTWFFRSIPRYVLLGLFAVGVGYLYNYFDIGIPFTDIHFFRLNFQDYSSTVWVGGLALGLSEGAYMAEIARAGILSVDKGQSEAAQALGMSPGQTMRRVVLPRPCASSCPDRQRDDRHGQGHLAFHRREHHRRAVLSGDVVRLAVLQDHVGLHGGDAVVPHRLLHPHGRPELSGATLWAWLRSPGTNTTPTQSQRPAFPDG